MFFQNLKMYSTEKTVFSNEATFYLASCVNRHNIRIWGSKNLHAVTEDMRDSLNCGAFWVLYKQNVFWSFLFVICTVTGVKYLDMLE